MPMGELWNAIRPFADLDRAHSQRYGPHASIRISLLNVYRLPTIEHIGVHKSNYTCEWATCSRRGIQQASRFALISHIRAHTGEKPFTCPRPGPHLPCPPLLRPVLTNLHPQNATSPSRALTRWQSTCVYSITYLPPYLGGEETVRESVGERPQVRCSPKLGSFRWGIHRLYQTHRLPLKDRPTRGRMAA